MLFLFVDNMEIELCGYRVLIDDEDFNKIKNHNWSIETQALKKGKQYFRYFDNAIKSTVTLHRLIMGCVLHDKKEVDHISGDTLDNRKQNLRIGTHTQNMQNVKRHKDNSTGYKGVDYNKEHKKYCARIAVNKRQIKLGYYKTAEEAYSVYCEASKKYHGEFGRIE